MGQISFKEQTMTIGLIVEVCLWILTRREIKIQAISSKIIVLAPEAPAVQIIFLLRDHQYYQLVQI